MDEASAAPELLDLTTEIVVAYAGSHTLPASELSGLIGSVFGTLRELGMADEPAPPTETLVPVVPITKSVTPEYLVCLEDGRKTKLLKPHLAKHHGLTPTAYRQRWGLTKDYPMTAPAYAAARSVMAKSLGLGRKPAAATSAPEPATAPVPAAAPVPEPAPVAAQPTRRVYMRKRTKAVE